MVHVQCALWFRGQVVHGRGPIVDGGECRSHERAPKIKDGHIVSRIGLESSITNVQLNVLETKKKIKANLENKSMKLKFMSSLKILYIVSIIKKYAFLLRQL